MIQSHYRIAAFVAAVLLTNACAVADVTPAGLFTDNMVLQRDVEVPVWGTAQPDEEVTVKLAGREANVITGAEGQWLVYLEPLKAGGPHDLTIVGRNTVTLKNVLIGEVWLCGGDANMQAPVERSGGVGDRSGAEDRKLRGFVVSGSVAPETAVDVGGKWDRCEPATAAKWSAVAYWFGKELQKSQEVPVGLIQLAIGDSTAEAWTSRATLEADPDLKYIVDGWDRWATRYPAAVQAHRTKLAEWNAAKEQARAAGEPSPDPPAAPLDPRQSVQFPGGLYNGMLAPLSPFAFRGVIWFGGEANAPRADEYRKLFPIMIGDWRGAWGKGDFPFLFAQLPAGDDAEGIGRAELREAQRQAAESVDNTGMAVTLDLVAGDTKEEHLARVKEIGRRLAVLARVKAYEEKDLVTAGPLYKKIEVEGDKIRVHFDELRGGLVARGGTLKGFTIAGDDRRFWPAEAKIDGKTVVVTGGRPVPYPVAVRYAFADNPDGGATLLNKAGMPASPFRTDDWPLTTAGVKALPFEMNP